MLTIKARKSTVVTVIAVLVFTIFALFLIVSLSSQQDTVEDMPRSGDDSLYAYIPWRSGAVTLDPQWDTSFEQLEIVGLEDIQALPTVPPTFDPWNIPFEEYPVPRHVQVYPLRGEFWSLTVGAGYILLNINENISLFRDSLGLEELLLRQGIEHGFLEDMQRIYQRDFSEYTGTSSPTPTPE